MTHAATARSTSPLERSILLAVLYGDVFDHPLSEAEIARYRPAVPGATADDGGGDANGDFHLALERLLEDRLTRVDGVICWRGREAIVEQRRRRRARAPARWRQARRFAGWLRHAPFVRMVAVCGSQAMENAGRDGDLDIFLIAARGRLWLVHFGAMALRRLAGLGGVEVCPNYLLSLGALEVEPRDLYVAREIAQTVPLWGEEAYDAFLAANAWMRELLPHLDLLERRRQLRRQPQSRLQRLLERPLAGRLGDAVDRALHAVLTRYYALRWHRHGWRRGELRRFYRRDRQASVGGGFAPAIAAAIRRRAAERLDGELDADLDRLLPATGATVPRRAEPVSRGEPFRTLFARRYGGGAGDG